MARKITYKEFYRSMKEDGLSDSEIKNLFISVQEASASARAWVIEWFFGGGYPKEQVEGITATFLIEEYGMNPINAFLTLNWLQEDPQAAKYFLVKKHVAPMITDAVEEKMLAFLDGRACTGSGENENPGEIEV